ncbi:MAG: PAS domain-containing protein [Hyphomicrobiales bacterium]
MIYFHFEADHEDIRKHADDHVFIRLLAFWELWRVRDGELPQLTSERRASLRWCRSNLSEISLEADNEWLYEAFGAQIVQGAGFDLSGMRVSDLPDDVAALTHAHLHRSFTSQKPLYVTLRTSATRTKTTWEQILLPFTSDAGKFCVLSYSLPVSQRYQLINGILDSTTDGILTLSAVRNEQGQLADFIIEDANEAAILLFGGVTSDVVNAQLAKDFREIYNSNFFRIAQHTTETGQPVRAEVSFTINGHHRWLRVAAAKSGDGAVVTFTDVTDERKRQAIIKGRLADLSKRNALATAIYEVAPTMLCTMNDEGVIIEANRAWLQSLGLSKSQTIGLPLVSLFNQKNYLGSGASVVQDIIAEGSLSAHPVELIRRDGTVLQGALSANTVSEALDGMWQAVVSLELNRNDGTETAFSTSLSDEHIDADPSQSLMSTEEIFLPDYKARRLKVK